MNSGAIVVLFSSLLVIWAVLNITFYFVRPKQYRSGWFSHFLMMGALWNIVNLLIGVYSLSFGLTNVSELNLNESLALDQVQILAVSILADFAYIATGVALYSFSPFKRSSMRKGFSLAILAQGSFLLAFDAAFISLLLITIIGSP
jgi:hypothetical protein